MSHGCGVARLGLQLPAPCFGWLPSPRVVDATAWALCSHVEPSGSRSPASTSLVVFKQVRRRANATSSQPPRAPHGSIIVVVFLISTRGVRAAPESGCRRSGGHLLPSYALTAGSAT